MAAPLTLFHWTKGIPLLSVLPVTTGAASPVLPVQVGVTRRSASLPVLKVMFSQSARLPPKITLVRAVQPLKASLETDIILPGMVTLRRLVQPSNILQGI